MVVLHMNMYWVVFIGVEKEYKSKVSIYVRHGFVYIPNAKLVFSFLSSKEKQEKSYVYTYYYNAEGAPLRYNWRRAAPSALVCV